MTLWPGAPICTGLASKGADHAELRDETHVPPVCLAVNLGKVVLVELGVVEDVGRKHVAYADYRRVCVPHEKICREAKEPYRSTPRRLM